MKITAISDLHGFYPKLPGGDLLIVAGDLTARDLVSEHGEFADWIWDQDYRKKVFIAGNHDNNLMGVGPRKFEYDPSIEYLCDSGTEFEGLKVWGSPWTLTFPGMNPYCKAFTVDDQEELKKKWELIPDDINILVTHCPPYGILDKISSQEHVGSKSLRNIVLSRERMPKLRVHIFGHIHQYGGMVVKTGTDFVNASIMDEVYDPIHKPVEIILWE